MRVDFLRALRAPLTPSIDGTASDFPLSVHTPTRVPSSICGASQSLATRARALTPDDAEPFDDLLPVTDGESQSRFPASGIFSIAAFQRFLLQSLQSTTIYAPPLHSAPLPLCVDACMPAPPWCSPSLEPGTHCPSTLSEFMSETSASFTFYDASSAAFDGMLNSFFVVPAAIPYACLPVNGNSWPPSLPSGVALPLPLMPHK